MHPDTSRRARERSIEAGDGWSALEVGFVSPLVFEKPGGGVLLLCPGMRVCQWWGDVC